MKSPTVVEFLGTEFECKEQGLKEGDNVSVRVAFNRVELHDYKEDGKLIGSVHFILYKGDHYHLTVRTDDGENVYVDTHDVWEDLDEVGIKIAPSALRISKR
jgi:spermidine/putrescine transport system ATP-binding protein